MIDHIRNNDEIKKVCRLLGWDEPKLWVGDKVYMKPNFLEINNKLTYELTYELFGRRSFTTEENLEKFLKCISKDQKFTVDEKYRGTDTSPYWTGVYIGSKTFFMFDDSLELPQHRNLYKPRTLVY
jgi:hypothetical protein